MNGKTPHIVQYQGSKRLLANKILQYMPQKINKLIEPFSGMAAITIAVAQENRCSNFVINDLNTPLSELLELAINNPDDLVERYTKLWNEQFEYEEGHESHYYKIRDLFNLDDDTPERMLYLLARCVKGAVRYGKNGYFNQSPDKRRNGTNPNNMKKNIQGVSSLLQNKAAFYSLDYREVLKMAEPGDLVYMDPPYQGVCATRDSRYYAGISFDEFVNALEDLNLRGIDYIVSYDGACGDQHYGSDLPNHLKCKKIMINAGLSSQATLLGKKSVTLEALYISSELYRNFVENNKDALMVEVI